MRDSGEPLLKKQMKKTLVLSAAAALLAVHAFASGYWVVMKDGTRYNAKTKPTINGNRATISMQSGSTLVVDAAQIDQAKSDEVTRLGGGELLGVEQPRTGSTAAQQPQNSLGAIRLRKLPSAQQAPAPQPSNAVAPTAPTGGEVQGDVIEKFGRAFESAG